MASKNGNGHKKRGKLGNLQSEPIIDAPEMTLEERIPFFVDAYFANGCNAQKAIRAIGCNDHNKGHRMMQLSGVRDEIARRLSEHKAGADEVLRVLSMHLRADIGLLLNEDGEFDWKLALERGVTRMIKKLKIRKHTEVDKDGVETTELSYELELHDSQAAASKLANILGLDQRPKENESDIKRKARMYERLVERVIERALVECGETLSRHQAIERLAAYDPAIREYIN
jgi:hypothetical protein